MTKLWRNYGEIMIKLWYRYWNRDKIMINLWCPYDERGDMLKVFIKEYMNGNKKRIGDILSLKKDEIVELLQKGLKKRAVKKILEEELKINIKDDTFYKWVKRNIENEPLTSSTNKKSNIEGGEVAKNEKVAQNGSDGSNSVDMDLINNVAKIYKGE